MDLTILVDDREKQPLIFPANMQLLSPQWPAVDSTQVVRLQTESVRMTTGDYAIKGKEWACIIERKKNLDEIAQNLLNPKRRQLFVAELERLREGCRYPVLFFEGSAATLLTPTKRTESPHKVADAFVRFMARYGVQTVFAPMSTVAQRRQAGEYAARILIAGVLQYASLNG